MGVIDVQQVRELAELMAEHGLTEIRLRQGDTFDRLRKGHDGAPAAPEAVAPEDEGLVPIVSPMVGTFYAAPDPESPPFVSPGTEIEIGTPVCIIEAMKVFNEIKAEVAGRVERILCKNEQAVE